MSIATPPVVVRIMPQIPLRDGEDARSWLGGRPSLPHDVEWPVGRRPARFLCQICCADLPAGLWEGLGPRDGWLLFFINPTEVAYIDPSETEMWVLHTLELGTRRTAPEWCDDQDDWANCWYHALLFRKQAHGPKRAHPYWPADLVAVCEGDPYARKPGFSKRSWELLKSGYDVADPAYRPFDWQTLLEMLDFAELNLSKFAASDAEPDLRRKLADIDDKMATAAATGSSPDLSALQAEAASLVSRIEFLQRREPVVPRALTAVREIAGRARAESASGLAPNATIDRVMRELAAVEHMTPSGPVPLTLQNSETLMWNYYNEMLRFDRAKHLYVEAPEALPPAVRNHFEALWRDVAAHEMASMGDQPTNYVDGFDPAVDVILLELPSSQLLGWVFGDVDDLVVTIKKADLAAGRFDKIIVNMSN
ncbi:DUF1963 domain-containing protein [Methylobrevis albus]|uniref:DUF1963 domain-containing protein n=1 Tax=Methylobrevis albus TaxID=2793297 RepID=A0A931I219_9HYPH|nr:DUF1963 domain-containing protein [Methylobrevis albus]MBH0237843.1 DUF1963 domain-containing protein [Methylobrevis albus]